MKKIFLTLISLYQRFFSSWMPSRCRFYPSCSTYMAEAIRQYGPWRGLGLGGRRLLKCHPWNAGGLDPVGGHHESH